MIFPAIPVMLAALLPVICLEAFVLQHSLSIAFEKAMKTAAFTNLVSTIIGIPVTWALLFLVQLLTGGAAAYGLDTRWKRFLAVTWQAPWLVPYESALYWMVPAAGLFLLIPFFFASWYVEYFFAKGMVEEVSRAELRRAVRNANLASYGLLALIFVLILVGAKPRV